MPDYDITCDEVICRLIESKSGPLRIKSEISQDGDIIPALNNTRALGDSSHRWSDLYVVDVFASGTATWPGGGSANANTAYDHSQDNTQAHSDYLLNSGPDTIEGVLTSEGLTVRDNEPIKLGAGGGEGGDLGADGIISSDGSSVQIQIESPPGGIEDNPTIEYTFFDAIEPNLFYLPAIQMNADSGALKGIGVVSHFLYIQDVDDTADGAILVPAAGSRSGAPAIRIDYRTAYNNGIIQSVASGGVEPNIVIDSTNELIFDADSNVMFIGQVYNNPVGGTNHALYIDNSGTIGSQPASSELIKEDIVDAVNSDSNNIFDLRLCTFNRIGSTKRELGMTAEQVTNIIPEAVRYKSTMIREQIPADPNVFGSIASEGRILEIITDYNTPVGIEYQKLIPHMLHQMQLMQAEMEAMKLRIEKLEKR